MSKAERKTFEISETKEEVFERDGWQCQVCGTPVTPSTAQLAHKIPQNKYNLAKYGQEVIHHPENLVTACSLRCNNLIQVNGPYQQKHIADGILQVIEAEAIGETTYG